MKKIIILITVLFFFKTSFSQYPYGTQTIGNDSNVVQAKGGFRGRVINWTYTDTSSANLERIRQYVGAQIVTTTPTLKFWIRNATATGWIDITSGGGGSQTWQQTLLVSGGSLLTQNNDIDVAGYDFRFSSADEFGVGADSVSISINQALGRFKVTGIPSTDTTLSLVGITANGYLVKTNKSSLRPYTFTNGITESGGTVKLGGTLVNSTTINSTGNELLFNNATDGFTSRFRQQSNGMIRLVGKTDALTGDSAMVQIAGEDLEAMLYVLDSTNGIVSRVLVNSGNEAQMESVRTDGSASSNISAFTTYVELTNSNVGAISSMKIQSDSLNLKPHLGQIYIDTLQATDTTEFIVGYRSNGQLVKTLKSSVGGYWTGVGNDIYNNNSGNVGVGTSTPTDKFQVFGGASKFDSAIISNAATGEDYVLRHRTVGLGFPVTTIKPVTDNKNIAFDIMPRGAPGNYSDNGIAWMDVCDTDVSDGAGAVGAARVGISSTAVEFGSRAFSGASAKPVNINVNTDTRITLSTSNTATFNIGKITQSQSVNADYVGYTLLNTNNTGVGSDAIMFIGNDFGTSRFGFLRWNNNAAVASAALRPNSLQIATNDGATGGIAFGAFGTNGKFTWSTGSGVGITEKMRLDSAGNLGIGTTTPTEKLTVEGGSIMGRWKARVGSTTSSGTPTINTDNVDIYKLTAQAADITSFTTNLSGTPNDGDILEIQITGTAARAITWGSAFVSSTVTLPATTVTTVTLTVVVQYFTTSSYGNNKWVCVNYF